MFFQLPPPQAPAQPPDVVRTESSYLQVAHKDIPLLLTRAAQPKAAGERALIRYQLFVRLDLEARQETGKPDAPPPPVQCHWVATSYLVREPCFESITGTLACGETYTGRLDDQARGDEVLPLTADATACSGAMSEIAGARARLAAALSATADARFGDDLARKLRPEYAKAGLRALVQPLK